MKRTALTTAQRAVLEDLIAEHGLIVSTQEVLDKLSFATEESKYRFVSQLSAAGWLVRIRHGLYQIADVSSLGVLTLSRLTIAQLLLPESYVSFQAALQHHGLFDQSLATIRSVSTQQRGSAIVQGTVYQYVRTRPSCYFGFADEVLDGRRVHIAAAEKALIDLVQFHRTSSAVDLVRETLADNRHQLDLALLTQWALRSPVAVARILGFLLEQTGIALQALKARAQESTSSTRLTDESSHYSSAWRVYYDPFFTEPDTPQ